MKIPANGSETMGESHSHVTTDCDGLSELPDSLIHSILSFLKMRYVVRTSFLSKRWKDVWTTIPCLDFGDAGRSFIEGALSKWKGDKVTKFSVFLRIPSKSSVFFSCGDDGLTTDPHPLDSWLLVPIQKQVEDLYLGADTVDQDEHRAPQPLYSCSSITRLTLSAIPLIIKEDVKVRWNHLKSLQIEYDSYLSEDAMNRILSGAPLLEELTLLSLSIMENLHIHSTSLKILKIGTCHSSVIVEANTELGISAPNLLSLQISGYVYGSLFLDVPALTDALLCFQNVHIERLPPIEMLRHIFRSINRAEKITLSHLTIQLLLLYMEEEEEEEQEENDMAVQFSNTNFLKLCVDSTEAWEMLFHVLDRFPNLITLVIELDKAYCIPLKEERSGLDIFKSLNSKETYPTPSLHLLKTLEISWCMYDASSFLPIRILLQNARLLEKIVFRPMFSPNHLYDRKLWLRLLRMLNSSTANVTVHKPSFA